MSFGSNSEDPRVSVSEAVSPGTLPLARKRIEIS